MKAKFGSRRIVSIYAICVALCLSTFAGLPNVFANTRIANLQTSQQNSTVTSTGETCPTLSDSQTLSTFGLGVKASELDSWHFVLPGTDTDFLDVRPSFSNSAQFTYIIQDFKKHAYVYTKATDRAVLRNASALVDGPETRFVLSHTCPGSAPVTQCQTPLNNRTPFSTELNNLTSPNVRVTILDGSLPSGWAFQNVTYGSSSTPINDATLTGSILTFTLPQGVTSVKVNFSTSLANCSPPNINLTFSFQVITCTTPIVLNPAGRSLGSFDFNVNSAPQISQKIFGTINSSSSLGIEYKLRPNPSSYFGVSASVVLDNGTTPGYIEVSGAPTKAGVFSFEVEATKGPCTTFEQYELTITQSCSITSFPTLPALLWNNLRVGTPLVSQLITGSPSTSSSLIDSYETRPFQTYSQPPSEIDLNVSSSGVRVSGTPRSSGDFAFTVVANFKDPACGPIQQVYFMTIEPAQPTGCTISSIPALPAKGWSPFKVGDSINDRLVASNPTRVSSYSVESIGVEDLPSGISFITGSDGVTIRGRFVEAGTYFFTVTADLNRAATNCSPVSSIYSLTVQPVVIPPTSPGPNTTPTPNPTPTSRPTVSPTPSPTVTPEDEPTSSPRPTPTVTVTVTAAPVATSTPQSIATPIPTPTRTTTIELTPPTAARSRSAISINCGEAVTLDLKALTADGSSFEITSLPKTGKILQPTPEVLIYIPDKEQCALGGNDTFSYALKDKSGNVKTVEKIVSPVIEGDIPKWIRTGYVGEGSSVGTLLSLAVAACFGFAFYLRRRKKSLK